MTLVLALLAAFYLSEYPVAWLPASFTSHQFSLMGNNLTAYGISTAVAFTIIFIVSMIMGHILTNSINVLIRESPLNIFNRLLGGLFGLARGAIVIVLLIVLLSLTAIPTHNLWQKSQLLPPFINVAERVVKWLPQQSAAHFGFHNKEELMEDEDLTEDNEETHL